MNKKRKKEKRDRCNVIVKFHKILPIIKKKKPFTQQHVINIFTFNFRVSRIAKRKRVKQSRASSVSSRQQITKSNPVSSG